MGKKSVPAAEQKLATSLAALICAYSWRAHETGEHRPDGACRSCRRLIESDLHELLGQLLFAALMRGADNAPASFPEAMHALEDVAARCAEICVERRERVVRSDPRTWDAEAAR